MGKLKEHFLDRLFGEYQAFKSSVLGCANIDIFNRCYEIDAVLNFYEILVEKADTLPDCVLEALLRHRNILMELYGSWLKKDDNSYRELEAHVEGELEHETTRTQAKENGGEKAAA